MVFHEAIYLRHVPVGNSRGVVEAEPADQPDGQVHLYRAIGPRRNGDLFPIADLAVDIASSRLLDVGYLPSRLRAPGFSRGERKRIEQQRFFIIQRRRLGLGERSGYHWVPLTIALLLSAPLRERNAV